MAARVLTNKRFLTLRLMYHCGMKEKDLPDMAYTTREIKEKTHTIYNQVLKQSDTIESGNFTSIAVSDVRLLFTLYDERFFHGFFAENYQGRVQFRLSQRMTKAAGKTEHLRGTDDFVIVLSTHLLFQTFHDVTRDIRVNGIVCHDRLQAMMRVFEHEIIHLIEHILFDSSSCSRPYFQRLAHNIFGHTDVTHRLITTEEIADKKFDLHVGDAVSFEYDAQVYEGVISRITKRATVMVKDPQGPFSDCQGNRYVKFYVPLRRLKKGA